MEIMKVENGMIDSLEVCRQINIFRNEEKKVELRHSDLMKVIRNEFEEEINEGKISHVKYKDKKGELRPMFNLTISQAKQVLVRESKFVRKAIIKRLEELENKAKESYLIQDPIERAKAWIKEEEERVKLRGKEKEFEKLLHQKNRLYRVTEIATETGFRSAVMLNKFLKDNNVQRKVNKTWVLNAKYNECGYVSKKIVEGKYHSDGRPVYDMLWTEKGKLFIIGLIHSKY